MKTRKIKILVRIIHKIISMILLGISDKTSKIGDHTDQNIVIITKMSI